MVKQFDLVGIGECLIELREESPDLYRQSVAGDVFNTLFYASRLGMRTGFISELGSDPFTADILQVIHDESIDKSYVAHSDSKTNGLYLISTNELGEPDYSFWRNDSAARQTLSTVDRTKVAAYLSSAEYFHFSAIAFAILNDREKLIPLIKGLVGSTKISFDTNFRKGLWDDVGILRKFIESSSPFVDVLFVSKADDEKIYFARPAESAMTFYRELGYRMVIYKQGRDDVLGWDGKKIFEIPPIENAIVVDATAAGDAFNAGFIAAQSKGYSFEDSIEAGNLCAAFVIGRPGGIAQDFDVSLPNHRHDRTSR
ncbi:MAG: sugar kinase [Bacteroidota bacterium]|nr:sugar kinase [Bacteroidota bacterium]MDP4235451.1 sugar kinase [Bacteroidota bacterium]